MKRSYGRAYRRPPTPQCDLAAFLLHDTQPAPRFPRLPPRERLPLLPNFNTYIMNRRRHPRRWDDSLETVDLKHNGHEFLPPNMKPYIPFKRLI